MESAGLAGEAPTCHPGGLQPASEEEAVLSVWFGAKQLCVFELWEEESCNIRLCCAVGVEAGRRAGAQQGRGRWNGAEGSQGTPRLWGWAGLPPDGLQGCSLRKALAVFFALSKLVMWLS